MIVARKTSMIGKLIDHLNKEGIEDYEVVDKITDDAITLTSSKPRSYKIYVPEDSSITVYDINDFVSDIARFVNTDTDLDRNIYVLNINGTLDQKQLFEIAKYIIDEDGYLNILQ